MKEQPEVKIDFSALEALEDKTPKGIKIVWTPELDAALLKYWPVKRHDQVSKILGICQTSCINRYRHLTES
jgi:hypothetical protein